MHDRARESLTVARTASVSGHRTDWRRTYFTHAACPNDARSTSSLPVIGQGPTAYLMLPPGLLPSGSDVCTYAIRETPAESKRNELLIGQGPIPAEKVRRERRTRVEHRRARGSGDARVVHHEVSKHATDASREISGQPRRLADDAAPPQNRGPTTLTRIWSLLTALSNGFVKDSNCSAVKCTLAARSCFASRSDHVRDASAFATTR